MNLYDLSGSGSDAEKFDQLLSRDGVTIERIISHGQATPEGDWYDQDWDEWVLVISGTAGLLLDGDSEVIHLNPGDSLFLPAHKKHRVEWTDNTQPTIWLAVHINQNN
ncbi:cupin domain-containing protein [Neptuniibacter sp.]|uniref:cupin domain-containing protein n=1 Tax=Neptuniibacter sp. TaxID=1962643 RepID=UPI002613A83D|nr:cupin domain-containing protein [Neptuniibacter sp.]MCP4596847.1 cupin domain-containing protein [Neptuniibacter sp.]